MSAFGLLGIFVIFAVVIPLSMLMVPYLLTVVGVKPNRPDRVKNDTYECGVRTYGGSWVRFNFRYYAISFLVFSIETVFLFPWAVQAKKLDWFGFGAMAVFIAVITIGLIYEWRKQALDWR